MFIWNYIISFKTLLIQCHNLSPDVKPPKSNLPSRNYDDVIGKQFEQQDDFDASISFIKKSQDVTIYEMVKKP